MSMRSCAGKTYQEIWEDYRQQVYPKISEHELLMIHKRWKALGSSIRNGVIFT